MKVGFVGLGARIANVGSHFKAFRPDMEFVSYVDPTPAGLPHVRKYADRELKGYETLEGMLKSEKLDLLMIGSPNHMHIEHLKTGLQSDVQHIFAEKPIVISEAETFELLELLKHHGGAKRVLVGLVLRYSPLYVALRNSLDSGQIGKVVSIEAAEHIGPYHGSFFMRDWRRYSKYSGGFMLEKCFHDLDLYQGVVGQRPRFVSSFGGRKSFVPENRPENAAPFPAPDTGDRVDPFTPRWGGANADFESDGDIIDYQTALVEYEDGTNLCFHTNMFVPDEFRRFAVMGTRGMAEGDFIRNYYKVHDAFTSRCLVDMPQVGQGSTGHYGADEGMARDLALYFEKGGDLPVSVLDALEAGLTAIKLDEARNSRSVIDMSETWQKFDSYGLA
ncbi:Gfo/Idh/MocA family protein [Roseibium sediminis]|uniref:Gfo/Idh/MocA family protein n=1 Tax=Roseibium sediminis TaxID=1775174 RepID=UPI00123D9724|nr:Gfo/Idh/MocA family oxidoreductase [Roseibium sediminis]